MELAQNAADAAVRAGVRGRLLLRLHDGVLTAANTGAPLDAPGVASLSTLRASAKRSEESTGRFGVGFAAVVALSERPSIGSPSGGVRWSRADTASELASLPAVAEEAARRGGAVPVLRLPFAAAPAVPDGYDTAVVLPLRDEDAARHARRLLTEVDPALLLSLPALSEVVVEVDGFVRRLTSTVGSDEVTIDDDGRMVTWRVASRSGQIAEALLADRPAEERLRRRWAVTAAVPVDGDGRPRPLPDNVPGMLRAPTVTDEPVSVPALLIGSYPLDPSRRHLSGGPLLDHLLDRSAETLCDLVQSLPPHPSVLPLVPTGFPAGPTDAQLRERLLSRLAETRFLPAAEAPQVRLRPVDAVVAQVPAEVVGVLAPVLAGLLPPGWSAAALDVLGVRRLSAADVVELLGSLVRPPGWWRALYDAWVPAAGGVDLDALTALPVPLADGRTVRGTRGLLMSVDPLPPQVSELGVRLVLPAAATPALRRLGVMDADPRAVLEDAAVRAAVAASLDEDDPLPIADAVLALVAAARISPGDCGWLDQLALPADDGEWYPAGELLLPGSAAAGLFAEDAPFGVVDAELVERVGAASLLAVGVLDAFAVLGESDVPLDPAFDLDGESEWVQHCRDLLPASGDVVLPELIAVRDLELVRPDAWPLALELLLAPALADVWRSPLAVGGVALPSYTAWWLSRHPVLSGRCPRDLRLPGGDPLLDGLFDTVAGDPALQARLGARRDLADALTDADDVLRRLADPARTVSRAQLRRIYAALADLDAELSPDLLRGVQAGRLLVADATDCVVLAAPDLRPFAGDSAVLPVPAHLAERLADVLDVELLASEDCPEPEQPGTPVPVPAAASELLDLPADASYRRHDRLRCADVQCDWRVVDGVPHVSSDAGSAALGRALAWVAGQWPARLAVGAALDHPPALPRLLDDADLDA
ncbi:MAG: hypothetical protein M3P91_12260 [Actinomycetota bacterium]|nr:hypothetical protein [Actinomycetota bacterium]